MKIDVDLDVLEGVLDNESWARNKLFDLIEEVTAEREPGEVCGFDAAWIGICKKITPCPEHKDKRCSKCKRIATRDCGHCYSIGVCGIPHCDDHRCGH